MSIVRPLSAKYTTEDVGSSLRITVPNRKNWFAVAFLTVWLIAYVFIAISARGLVARSFSALMREALSTPAAGWGTSFYGGLCMLAVLGMWFVGATFFALYGWLLQVTGKEIIEASDYSITIRKVVAGFSYSKEYLAEHVKDLRAVPNQVSDWQFRSMAFWGLSDGGALAFDYGAKAFYFLSGADEAEARQIVAMIKGRFPALARGVDEEDVRLA